MGASTYNIGRGSREGKINVPGLHAKRKTSNLKCQANYPLTRMLRVRAVARQSKICNTKREMVVESHLSKARKVGHPAVLQLLHYAVGSDGR